MTIVWLWWVLWGCQSNQNPQQWEADIRVSFPDTAQISSLDGKQLAYTYCQLCHTFPEPGLLTKTLWKNRVLPMMAQRLGLADIMNPYNRLSYDEIKIVTEAEVFPFEKKITDQAWQKIEEYYVTNAPDSMAPQSDHGGIAEELPFFSVEEIDLEKGFLPQTTLLNFDSASSTLWVGNAENKINVLDQHFQVTRTLSTESPAVGVVKNGNSTYLLEIGILNPNDEQKGSLFEFDSAGKQYSLLKNLPRPVHLSIADLNQDGKPEYVVSNFGYRVGNLSWYEFDEAGNGQTHVLSKNPGARNTIIYDFNKDGLPDIAALMTQGDERIILFYNEGNNRFRPETVLHFPPIYGSSYFEMADFNQDGHMDILYANGDNADFSYELKNYHGIRIYENQGNNQFKETFFYPMYGATMAKAEDFDQDGDLDIAAIAYFADYDHTPEKGFIYFENTTKNGYPFKAYTLPEAKKGRWLTFDIGDIDQDGDQDIMLGAFEYPSTTVPRKLQESWTEHGPDVLILKNRLREGVSSLEEK